jgi:predicted transcriptional regulator
MVFKHLWNTTRKQILSVLVKQPSAGHYEIAGLLGFTGATITWHMKLLEADRIITVQRSGRIVWYVIPDNVNYCLNDYLSA